MYNECVGFSSDTLDCLERGVAFSPPLWSMCSDCVASLLLMVNFSGNFLIYCSALKSFRGKLKQIWQTSSQKTNGTRRQSRVSVKISEIQSTSAKLLNILVPLHWDARARPLFVGTDLGLGHTEADIFPKATIDRDPNKISFQTRVVA